MTSYKKPKIINPDEVDPSVYYYDEVYDDMQRAKDEDEKIEKKTKQREGSKYIQGISETAERRKSEKEIRKFRRYARDREEAQTSGDLQNEDVYISKTYEKKLKEVQEALEKQSKPDDERAFNVFKKVNRSDENEKSIREQHPIDPKECSSARRNQDCDTRESNVVRSLDISDETGAQPSIDTTRLKRPTTIEERRDYLKKVLAKRTTGDVLKAAQERYRQRKHRS